MSANASGIASFEGERPNSLRSAGSNTDSLYRAMSITFQELSFDDLRKIRGKPVDLQGPTQREGHPACPVARGLFVGHIDDGEPGEVWLP